MRGWKRNTLAILALLMLFVFSSVNVANAAKAEIVSDVSGLRNYVPGDNSYTHGSTLKVYTEMSNVNYEGFVFVEFVFIIEDPKGNVVSMDRMDVERRDYTDHAYVVYSKKIPSWWQYGKYKLEIYAYDRLNKAKIRELERRVEDTRAIEALLDEGNFDDLEEFFEKGSDADDLGVIKSFSDSEREKTRISFYVRRPEEIKPAEPEEAERVEEQGFTITGVGIDKFKVQPGEPVTISVAVENRGVRGTKTLTLVINGEKEAEESVTLGSMESKTLHFSVQKDLPGTYKVTIPGTNIIRLFFVEEPSEEQGNSTAFAPVPVAQQPGEGGGEGGEKGLPNHVFVSVAFIALLAIVILLLRANSKQLSFSRSRR
ncbi:MAG: hypothetical protein JJE19_05405 [Methanosarcinales archaeon]|nr:hypothetical protein [Methanosarcinales archaeon]